MNSFGSLRIASVLAILFLSLVACIPSETLNDEYSDDSEYDQFSTDYEDKYNSSTSPTNKTTVFISKPLVVEARPGDTVELPCVVINADEIAVTWWKNETMLFLESTQIIDDKRLTWAKNRSLIIRNVTENDASDLWHCRLTLEDPIDLYHKLHIVEKPRELLTGIQVTPSRRVEVNENESVTLGCEINNGPRREIKWFHKGEQLHNNNEVNIEGNYLTIKKITMHHAGQYQCLVEDNSKKPPTDAMQLIVGYAPHINVEHPVVYTGTERRSELTCIVYAHPHADVTWYKDNRKLNTENGDKTQNVENKSHHLIIEHTTNEDLGVYICKAKNKFGEMEKTITLTGVPSQPRFHGGEVLDNETIILKWQVESFAPIVKYKLEYRKKGEKEWRMISPRVTNGNGIQFTVEYPLEKLQPGLYEAKLMAKNNYGWSQHSAIRTFRQEYKLEERAEIVKGSAVMHQPLLTLIALFVVVVTSYESLCL